MKKILSILSSVLMVVFSALVIAFMACPYYLRPDGANYIGGSFVTAYEKMSGFASIGSSGGANAALNSDSLIVMIVFAALLIIIGIFKILEAIKVVKVHPLAVKIINFVALAFSVVLAVFASISLGCINAIVVEYTQESIKYFPKVGWACIFNLIISLVIVAVAVVSILFKDKTIKAVAKKASTKKATAKKSSAKKTTAKKTSTKATKKK